MMCDNCARLTRELREARELIDEYERPGSVIDTRIYRVKNWLGRPCWVQGAKMLVAMLDAPGKIIPRDRLAAIIEYQGDMVIDRILTVNASRLNKALIAKGMPRVKNAHGQGYYLDAPDADVVRAAMESDG